VLSQRLTAIQELRCQLLYKEIRLGKINGKFPEFFPELKKKGTASQQGQAVVTDTGKPASGPSPLVSSVAPALEIESIGYQTSQFQDKESQRRSTAVDRSVADFEASIPAYKQEQDVNRNAFYLVDEANAGEFQELNKHLAKRKKAEEEHQC
jgi:hypothetical protein